MNNYKVVTEKEHRLAKTDKLDGRRRKIRSIYAEST